MAQWTHNICSSCWLEREKDRVPRRILNAPKETCCFCGKENTDGIFVRQHPEQVKFCKCEED